MENKITRKHLEEINMRIVEEENRAGEEGNIYLSQVIAPKLAFLRADKSFDDREEYLKKILNERSTSDRHLERFEEVQVFGSRAVVTCVVKMNSKFFHNIRVFAVINGEWKLFAWANEEMLW